MPRTTFFLCLQHLPFPIFVLWYRTYSIFYLHYPQRTPYLVVLIYYSNPCCIISSTYLTLPYAPPLHSQPCLLCLFIICPFCGMLVPSACLPQLPACLFPCLHCVLGQVLPATLCLVLPLPTMLPASPPVPYLPPCPSHYPLGWTAVPFIAFLCLPLLFPDSSYWDLHPGTLLLYFLLPQFGSTLYLAACVHAPLAGLLRAPALPLYLPPLCCYPWNPSALPYPTPVPSSFPPVFIAGLISSYLVVHTYVCMPCCLLPRDRDFLCCLFILPGACYFIALYSFDLLDYPYLMPVWDSLDFCPNLNPIYIPQGCVWEVSYYLPGSSLPLPPHSCSVPLCAFLCLPPSVACACWGSEQAGTENRQ